MKIPMNQYVDTLTDKVKENRDEIKTLKAHQGGGEPTLVSRHVEITSGTLHDFSEGILNYINENNAKLYYKSFILKQGVAKKDIVGAIPKTKMTNFFEKDGSVFTIPHEGFIKDYFSIDGDLTNLGAHAQKLIFVDKNIKNQWQNNVWNNNDATNAYHIFLYIDVHHNADGYVDKIRVRYPKTSSDITGQYLPFLLGKFNISIVSFQYKGYNEQDFSSTMFSPIEIISTINNGVLKVQYFITNWVPEYHGNDVTYKANFFEVTRQSLSSNTKVIVEYMLDNSGTPI